MKPVFPMVNPLTSETLQFLGELSLNNNREWFQSNKSRYEQYVKAPFIELVGALLEYARSINDIGLPVDPKQCVFRLHRDVRFSKDKRPYKEHMAALIGIGGTKNKELPGFYFHIALEGIWIGGGAYFVEPATLKRMRHFFSLQPHALQQALSHDGFQKYFGNLQGEKSARLAPELRQAAATQPLLYNKQFFFSKEFPVERALDPGFLDLLRAHYRASMHMNRILIQAMAFEL